jgi:hypothetical protein
LDGFSRKGDVDSDGNGDGPTQLRSCNAWWPFASTSFAAAYLLLGKLIIMMID